METVVTAGAHFGSIVAIANVRWQNISAISAGRVIRTASTTATSIQRAAKPAE
jgi:hypothetical protein